MGVGLRRGIFTNIFFKVFFNGYILLNGYMLVTYGLICFLSMDLLPQSTTRSDRHHGGIFYTCHTINLLIWSRSEYIRNVLLLLVYSKPSNSDDYMLLHAWTIQNGLKKICQN